MTLHLFALTLVVPRHELALLQEKQSVCTSPLNADASQGQAHLGDFKPPKHSFIDYSTFFSPRSFLPAYNPTVSALFLYEPFQALPEIYLEIYVPPNNPA